MPIKLQSPFLGLVLLAATSGTLSRPGPAEQAGSAGRAGRDSAGRLCLRLSAAGGVVAMHAGGEAAQVVSAGIGTNAGFHGRGPTGDRELYHGLSDAELHEQLDSRLSEHVAGQGESIRPEPRQTAAGNPPARQGRASHGQHAVH